MEAGIEITDSMLRTGDEGIVVRTGILEDLVGLLDMLATCTPVVIRECLCGFTSVMASAWIGRQAAWTLDDKKRAQSSLEIGRAHV